MATYYVSAQLEWAKVEPDGSSCQCCSEDIYLQQWACHITVMGGVAGTIALCDACKEVLDGMKEGLDEDNDSGYNPG